MQTSEISLIYYIFFLRLEKQVFSWAYLHQPLRKRKGLAGIILETYKEIRTSLSNIRISFLQDQAPYQDKKSMLYTSFWKLPQNGVSNQLVMQT